MTDSNFAPTKFYQSNKFAVHRSLQRRGGLGLHELAAPRALTSVLSLPKGPHSGFSEQEDFTAYWTLKQHPTSPHAYLRAPHKQARDCAISLGDPHTFLYSSNAQIHA